MISLNFRDSRPIYEQIKDSFKKLVVSGAMKPNDKLPSVRELSSSLAINPNTIQRAYRELEQEGYIYSVPGKGSFASPQPDSGRIEALLADFKNLTAELLYLGADPAELMAIIQNINNKEASE